MPISEVYDVPDDAALQCRVGGRLALPGVMIELHHYRFLGPQAGVFRSSRGFLDLALSPRPGPPMGGFAGTPARRALGEVLFVPADHALETEWGAGEQTSICCAFDSDEEAAFDLAPAGLEAALDVRSAPVRETMMRLAREIAQPGWCSEALAEALCTQLLVELGRHMRGSAIASAAPAGLTKAQLRTIDELIEQPGKLPRVADLARQCECSTRHFFRLFRAATGATFADYAATRRVARARALLATARPPIKEIAWRCGFDTAAAFSAAFRRDVGVTPSEYRRALIH